MKLITCLFFISITNCFAGIEIKSDTQYYQITNSKIDNSISKGNSKIQFTFKEHSGICLKNQVKIIANSKNAKQPVIDTNGISDYNLKSGSYVFKFWTDFCDTIVTEKINIKSQSSISILVHFHSNQIIMESDKPVIYLYPNTTTEVTVQLNYNGKLKFTYPQIKNNEWKVKASPDGTLQANGKLFNYLFWDGEMKTNSFQTNLKEGSVVESKNLVSYFESSLTKMGMNSKEIADFITYWVPRMMKNDKNYIHFMLTNEYDKIASLNVSPKPDNILRVYMLWSKVSADTPVINSLITFPKFTRNGFTLIEWGGSEIHEMLNHI